MKLLKSAFTLAALIACSSATAHTDVAFQQVMDRNANEYIAHNHDNRIFWSALLKGLVGYRSTLDLYENTNTNTIHKRSVSDIVLPRANIFMDAVVNDWVLARVALSFHGNDLGLNAGNFSKGARPQNAGNTFYTRAGVFTAFDGLTYRPYKIVDEAYVTVGNLHRHPAYARMGLGRVPFGLYDRNKILVPWTTLMSEVQTIYAQLGVSDASGFNAAIYAFRGLAKHDDLNATKSDWRNDGYANINNFGATIGYCMNKNHMGISLVVDWVYNYAGALNLVRAVTTDAYTNPMTSQVSPAYRGDVMGMHVGYKAHYNQFDLRANYVTALKKFKSDESSTVRTLFEGSKPGAMSVEGGVHFKLGRMPSRFALGYEHTFNMQNDLTLRAESSSSLVGIMHEHRISAEVTSEVLKNVTVGLHYALEAPYKRTFNATSDKTEDKIHTALFSLTTKVA